MRTTCRITTMWLCHHHRGIKVSSRDFSDYSLKRSCGSRMFGIAALMMMCAVCGVASVPTVLYSRPIVVENGPGPHRLVGVANLGEKSLPVVQSQRPVALPGTKNLGERIQVDFTRDFRGNANLAEKAIPEEIIALARHR